MSAAVSEFALPIDPAGQALDELLSLLAAEGPLDEEAVLALFHPSFIAAVGPEPLLQGLEPHRATLRASTLLRAAGRAESDISAVFSSPEGSWKFQLSVAEGQIAMLQAGAAGPTSGVSWEQLLASEPAPSGTTRLAPALASALDALVDTGRLEQRLPAVVAAVADATGEILWSRAAGVVAVDPLTPATTEMGLRIGSITKTMTAGLVLQLVDEGRISLDDDVNDHLTSYRVTGPGGEAIQVRQLLSHTSGLGMRPGVEIGCPAGEEPALADFYGPQLIGLQPPGNAFTYSNDAFAALGQLVADVTGLPLAERAVSSLFDPLGMSSTSFVRDARTTRQLLDGVDVDAGELAPVPFHGVIVLGAGSVFSTLSDMALYGAAIHGRGRSPRGRFLSEEAFTTMTTPVPDVQGLPPGTEMCLGWLRVLLPDSYVLWHNGGWPGARSELAVLPEHGYTVLLFTNTLDADIDGLCMQLAATLSSPAS